MKAFFSRVAGGGGGDSPRVDGFCESHSVTSRPFFNVLVFEDIVRGC